ncbi:MAG: hypothetical protein K6T57_10145 [Thermaceae bacterium]|nr:hypothetical protein [Thermaceae bacterium]
MFPTSAKTGLASPRCALCAAEIQGEPLWVVIEGKRYPAEDASCARLLSENPVAALGPRAELFYRPNCPRCQAKVALWQEAQQRRSLRLDLKPTHIDAGPCPRLLLEGQEDPITLEIEELEELLLWLWIQHPGFVGCC